MGPSHRFLPSSEQQGQTAVGKATLPATGRTLPGCQHQPLGQLSGFPMHSTTPSQQQRLPRWLSGKESACQCWSHGRDPWVGKIPWRRAWHPLQYSCLENPMDRGDWWATVHRVAKSQTELSTHTGSQISPDSFLSSWSHMGHLSSTENV